jgi:hypothetical protein
MVRARTRAAGRHKLPGYFRFRKLDCVERFTDRIGGQKYCHFEARHQELNLRRQPEQLLVVNECGWQARIL